MANNFDYLFKYIIIGDSSVGKSNLLMKFIQNKFTEEYLTTIGVEFGTKNIKINNKIYRIQIWDTAGQEYFRSIAKAYFKNCVCAMLVYDITCKESFDNIKNWLQDIHEESPKTVLIVLIGNKIDLEDKRIISFDDGKNFANENGLIFMETSAKTGEGINEIFEQTIKEINKKIEENFYDLNSETCGIKKGKTKTIDLNSDQNKIKKNCC